MTFQIKKAGLDDLDEFFKFFTHSLKTQFPQYSSFTISHFLNYDYALSRTAKGLTDGWRQIYLALDDKKIIGILMADINYGGIAFCNWVAVDSDFQKRGVASALLLKWERQALLDGAHKLHLWTDKRNLDFYKHQGFILVGDIPHNYFGSHDYLFYKTIGEPQKDYLQSK